MKLLRKIKRIFSSSNRYFFQPDALLSENRRNLDLILQLKGYALQQRTIYLSAYDYFVIHPEQFDGATMTEDLPDIDSLELAAMLHDYLYIQLNAAGSFKYILKADLLLRSEMRKMKKSSWNAGARFILLMLKTPFFVPYAWLFKKRKMTDLDKTKFDVIYLQIKDPSPDPWFKTFKGEISWMLILLSYIFLIINFFTH